MPAGVCGQNDVDEFREQVFEDVSGTVRVWVFENRFVHLKQGVHNGVQLLYMLRSLDDLAAQLVVVFAIVARDTIAIAHVIFFGFFDMWGFELIDDAGSHLIVDFVEVNLNLYIDLHRR